MAWLGRTPVTSKGLMQPSVSPWAAERTKAQRDGLTSAPMPTSGLGTPLLCWAVLMPSCCPLFGTRVTGSSATRGSQGTLQRQVALMGMLPLSLPAISQEPGSSRQPLGELRMGKVLNLQQTLGDK